MSVLKPFKPCEATMIDLKSGRCRSRTAFFLLAALAALSMTTVDASATSSAAPGGKAFATPRAAAAALAAAWASGRRADLLAIFGPAGDKLVNSGDPVAERDARQGFAKAYAQAHRIVMDRGRAVLIIGGDDWPYPIPLVKRQSGWVFDVAMGEQQVLDRRIGRNELNAIATCRAYVMAQRAYAMRRPAGLVEFAQRVESTPGKRDGLYWPAATTADESPLGPRVAVAEAEGYGAASREGLAPFQGYYFRVLTAQGRHASGGARSYIEGGHMVHGFALVAFPARYGDFGVMTFIVDEAGVVFEKNLGPATDRTARVMSQFDPDLSWKVAESPGADPLP